jgi:hypothetical protein
MDNNWAEQLTSFLKTPLGKELVRSLKEDLHDNLIKQAETANSQELAYGLIKEAGGVIKSIDHMTMLAVVARDKGAK